jgi:mRNA-degrading endonuclease RelE of RelBE toxin-antitoxin system
LAYSLHILARAERDIKKIKKHHHDLVSRLADQIRQLSRAPRPFGYEPVEGRKDVYRIYSDDNKYRIIYSIQDHLQAVIVITIRRRNEGTYKQIAKEDLSHKIELLTLKFKETAQLAKSSAREMNIDWVVGLEENHIWNPGIWIQAVKDGRSSLQAAAEPAGGSQSQRRPQDYCERSEAPCTKNVTNLSPRESFKL